MIAFVTEDKRCMQQVTLPVEYLIGTAIFFSAKTVFVTFFS
jgi:hypothetical protein